MSCRLYRASQTSFSGACTTPTTTPLSWHTPSNTTEGLCQPSLAPRVPSSRAVGMGRCAWRTCLSTGSDGMMTLPSSCCATGPWSWVTRSIASWISTAPGGLWARCSGSWRRLRSRTRWYKRRYRRERRGSRIRQRGAGSSCVWALRTAGGSRAWPFRSLRRGRTRSSPATPTAMCGNGTSMRARFRACSSHILAHAARQ
mmetsp:Transcript_2524/g.6130  ORF Transcript_2524/g.6130 Transcript_2524/m.6130 type:complete len:200 (+) Transcript_2524:133-732(+)